MVRDKANKVYYRARSFMRGFRPHPPKSRYCIERVSQSTQRNAQLDMIEQEYPEVGDALKDEFIVYSSMESSEYLGSVEDSSCPTKLLSYPRR
jgi:hypothetical protein